MIYGKIYPISPTKKVPFVQHDPKCPKKMRKHQYFIHIWKPRTRIQVNSGPNRFGAVRHYIGVNFQETSKNDLRSKRTLNKHSSITKSDLRKEYLEDSPFYHSTSVIYSKLNISSDKLNTFLTSTLNNFIAYQLLPEVVEINMVRWNNYQKNFRGLNEILKPFGFKLNEIEELQNFYDLMGSTNHSYDYRSFNSNPLSYNTRSFLDRKHSNLNCKFISYANCSFNQ